MGFRDEQREKLRSLMLLEYIFYWEQKKEKHIISNKVWSQ